MPDDLNEIIGLTDKIMSRWGLTMIAPLKRSSRGVVCKVTYKGEPAVLKTNYRYGVEGGAVPFLQQIPDGLAAGLLRSSPLRRALLLEWVEGPTLLQMSQDGQETEAEALWAEAALRLRHVRFRYPFVFNDRSVNLSNRFKKLSPKVTGKSVEYLARTMALFDQLALTSAPKRIIHGDLHFDNIILTSNGLRMIDAKGYKAEPAVECAKGLVDLGRSSSVDEFGERIARRAQTFAKLMAEDERRLIQWGAVIWVNSRLQNELRYQTSLIEEAAYIDRFLELAEG